MNPVHDSDDDAVHFIAEPASVTQEKPPDAFNLATKISFNPLWVRSGPDTTGKEDSVETAKPTR